MEKTLEIAPEAKNVIEQYLKLKIGEKSVVCPYYINTKRAKDLRVMVGKGTPEEIEMETQIWAKLKGFDLTQATASEIRTFLMGRGIGIDCSGFVMHVLNAWYKNHYKKNIWKKLKIPNKSILAKVAYALKPVEKLGAEVVTNEENAKKIKVKDIKPGDVVRSKWKKQNSHHILLITKVTYKDNLPTLIEYTHSSQNYGEESGIRVGQIRVTNPAKDLKDQEWLETDKDGTKQTYEGYMVNVKDNGIRRINAIAELINKL